MAHNKNLFDIPKKRTNVITVKLAQLGCRNTDTCTQDFEPTGRHILEVTWYEYCSIFIPLLIRTVVFVDYTMQCIHFANDAYVSAHLISQSAA